MNSCSYISPHMQAWRFVGYKRESSLGEGEVGCLALGPFHTYSSRWHSHAMTPLHFVLWQRRKNTKRNPCKPMNQHSYQPATAHTVCVVSKRFSGQERVKPGWREGNIHFLWLPLSLVIAFWWMIYLYLHCTKWARYTYEPYYVYVQYRHISKNQ